MKPDDPAGEVPKAAGTGDDAVALPFEFYARPTLSVARELLGKRLCRLLPSGEQRSGVIVEVEAYLGLADKASHARLQRRGGAMVPTPRSAVMFGPPGNAYVYLIYGMHSCINVVAHRPGEVGAVLLRALMPLPPLASKSCRGPARLCYALEIDRRLNGSSLLRPALPSAKVEAALAAGQLWLAPGPEPVIAESAVAYGPRIGVEYAEADALLPYRMCLRGHPDLSRPMR